MNLTTEIFDEIARIKGVNPNHVIYSNKQFLELMGVCDKTAQKWRDEGVIRFSQIGKSIFYRLADVLIMLDENENKPRV